MTQPRAPRESTKPTGSSESTESWGAVRGDVVRAFRVPFVLVLVLCGIELVNTILLHRLNAFGVVPRTAGGLVGVVFMPLLHGGWGHVIGNSVAVMLFGTTMMLMRPRGEMLFVSLFTAVVAGLFVWCVGASGSHHVGYSGVLFGYFGYLVSIGAFERKPGTVLLSVAFALVYGTMIFGVLPGQTGVSWEGHLGGFGAGIAAAGLVSLRNRRIRTPSAAV